jgi:hypothetical protein
MKKIPMLGYWIALAVIVVIANLPLIPTAYAGWLAQSNDCTIIAGGTPPPCEIDGVDRGRNLQDMSNAGLYVLLTWPLGAVLFIVWLVVLLAARGRWKREQLRA